MIMWLFLLFLPTDITDGPNNQGNEGKQSYSLLSTDVTKIQTPKSQGPLRYYLHLAKDLLKVNSCESFQQDSVFRFENIALSVETEKAITHAKK